MPVKIQKYGWKLDHLDHRDRWLPTVVARVPLPKSVDLRTTGFVPPVYDQGQLGSCTANAISAAMEFRSAKQGKPFVTPSRLFIYYNEREMEGTVDQDAGAEIRDGITSVVKQGVCPETEWPYSDQGQDFAQKPSVQCYADATKDEALTYSRVTQLDYYVQHSLAILGVPVVFGFSVFDSFESDEVAATGIVPMPGPNDAPIGGHAVCAVGYDTSKKAYLIRNSWGDSWGLQGYFWMPSAYLMNPSLASDFWVVESGS